MIDIIKENPIDFISVQFGCGGVTQQEISYFKSQDFPAASQNRLICSFTIELLPATQQILVEFLFFEVCIFFR